MQLTLKQNKELWEIWIKEAKWRDIHCAIFGKKLSLPVIQSIEEWQLFFDEWECQKVKKYVYWRLSKQSYHSEMLEKLLRKRLVQKKTIERVLEECKNQGLLDDESWIQNFWRMHKKRYGLSVVISKLRAKGLSVTSLKQLATQGINLEDERETIRHLIQTRYRNKDLSQYEIRRKVVAALLRRGYKFDQIKQALTT